MATVTREPIGKLHDKLVVALTKEDYYPSFEKALKQYGKTANIQGFRKGMVPTGMIRKMYGQSVFAEEVVRSANKELNHYLEETGPQIFAQPLVIEGQDLKLDMNKTEEINIAFEIGLKPEFEVTVLKEKGKLTRYTIKVSDELLKKETENLRRRTGKLENPESPEELSDMVYNTYTICDEAGNVAGNVEVTEDVVTLENLPKALADAVKGQKAGFTYVFKPAEVCDEEHLRDFMESALKKGIADKDQYFKFTLTKTGRLIPSEMNAEFFKKVFPNEEIKDEEQFNKRLKEELGKEAAHAGKDRLESEIFETLIHETKMDLPVTFLKDWLKRGDEKQKSNEEVEQEFPDFDHRLRWTLISEKLIKDFNLEISEDEVKEDLKSRVLTYFGMKKEEENDASWLDDYLKKMAQDEKTMQETHGRLLFNKLFDKVASEMEVKEAVVDEETFSKLPHTHHHH